jgi:hypothetical protein
MSQTENEKRSASAFPPAFAGYAFSILYVLLGGLGLSIDFEEGKYLLVLGIASSPVWDHLGHSPRFRKAMGAARWGINLAVGPIATVVLIYRFLQGFH